MTREFQTWLDAVATASGFSSERVLELWRDYCRNCETFDQSPVQTEFCQWYRLPEVR